MASDLQGGRGCSEQDPEKANHHAERISAAGAKTAAYRTDEKTTGTANNDASEDTQVLEALIFSDGFESGDTSAWSSTVP